MWQRGALRALAVWLLLLSSNGALASSEQCSAPTASPPEPPLRDWGGLSSLVRNAEATRNHIVPGDLPFQFISTEVGKA